MKRKKQNRANLLKKPVFEPFGRADGNYMIFSDEELRCVEDDTTEEDLETMGIDALEALRDSLEDDIMDYDTIIESQLNSKVGFDAESLRNDRRRRQTLIVELRKVTNKIEMLNYENEEVAIAI